MIDKCPYCNKTHCVPEVAYNNCDMYGNIFFTVKCNYCKKVIEICFERVVRLLSIEKSNKESDECDW